MNRIAVAASAFGNTFTLPIVFLVEVLGAAFGDRVAGYVALYLIGWSPALWTVGYALVTGAASEASAPFACRAPFHPRLRELLHRCVAHGLVLGARDACRGPSARGWLARHDRGAAVIVSLVAGAAAFAPAARVVRANAARREDAPAFVSPLLASPARALVVCAGVVGCEMCNRPPKRD